MSQEIFKNDLQNFSRNFEDFGWNGMWGGRSDFCGHATNKKFSGSNLQLIW